MLFAKQIHRNKIKIIGSLYHRRSIRLKGYDFNLVTLKEVEQLMQGDGSRRVNR
ncbi:MAG: hypothetical protein LBQ28_02490 [Prevotellaceae bacterium]|jgi:hypothetical protein|nr:hypothetical protein [Prevotellaceae bacterium]